ncbi:putative 2-dehydropantoate 2-reductase [Rhodopirellula halodulae]|uniref:putative 2-dehydropantoate 2-reductase n=1 Tax=Rhodopirellula halodulae TaxID=2894198 RepID=UPI001E33D8FA|nr:putative 2-dehydropantoate 2-reductase [Rhodopirellula sp. JC737]MCC9658624.1 putative 2-dehydropantoate 2-reductase [Rhodopirellula sp. JC737]
MNADAAPLRYAILGSGAVGGLYGAMLTRSGCEVHFLLHSDYDHVVANGMRIDSVQGDFILESPHVHASVDSMPVCDVVIIALKSTRNALLDDWLPKLVADDGVVLTLQNGLDVEADVRRTVPAGRVLGGCCFLCSNKVGPGHIHHLDYGRIAFGAYQETGVDAIVAETMGKRIEADMQNAGIDANWSDDLAKTRWRKLMWNIPFNGLSVVLDASTDQIIGSEPGRALANRLITEVHAGAAACGVEIDSKAIRATMEHTETMVPYDSSMRLDFLAKRPMEVEAIFGNPLRAIGDRASEIAPSVCMLYEQLAFYNETICQSA